MQKKQIGVGTQTVSIFLQPNDLQGTTTYKTKARKNILQLEVAAQIFLVAMVLPK